MDAASHIHVKGAREHNLRNLELRLPRGRLVVLTGPSGSGKSSLAFDTIYAEGYRKYMESLSASARQVLEHFESDADLSTFTDNYQTALKELLESKRPTAFAEAPAGKAAKPAKVVNLMEALRQSLERIEKDEPRRKPKAARAVLKHPGGRRRKAS